MPWTEITRPDYDRRGLRYASDTTDAEWEFVAPFLEPRSAVGRPREVSMRNVWDAIQYIAASGCPWRMLPTDFPPVSTVQYHFYRLRDGGLLDVINEALVMAARLVDGREAVPTAGINRQPIGQDDRGGRRSRLRRGQEGQRPKAPYFRGIHKGICCSARCTAPPFKTATVPPA